MNAANAYGDLQPIRLVQHVHFVLEGAESEFVTTFDDGEGWSLESCTCGFLYWRAFEPEAEWEDLNA